MKLKFGIKEVVAIGIGTALFVVLTNVQVPFMIIPNTALQSRVAVLTFFSAVFGPIVGGAIGIIGHALGDALFYGSVWWSWVFPDDCSASSSACSLRSMRLRKADLPERASFCSTWFRLLRMHLRGSYLRLYLTF